MTHTASKTFVARALAGATTLALVGTLAACSDDDGGASTATASTTATATSGSAFTEQAAAAATWAAGKLGDSGLLETEFDGVAYPDQGLTADLVLALVAVGDPQAADVAATLADPATVAAYVGDGTTQYAGSTAKLAATLAAADVDPTDLGGRDLLAELAATQQDSGRFSDQGGDDYSQTISQSWGVLAQAVAGDGADAGAVDYLIAQQCDDGGFSATLEAAECVSDVDATGFAVSALVAADADADAVSAATDWLGTVAETDADGAFWQTGDPAAASVNSTGVVAAALQDAGVDAADAQGWVAAQAVTEGADAGALTLAGTADVRSTTQGALALAGTGLAGLFD